MTDNLLNVLKVFTVILLIVALVMGGWLLYKRFIADDGPGDDGGNTQVTLDWWILWEDPEDVKILVELYQQENPNVTINVTKQLENQYREKLLGQISDNDPQTGPDIMRVHNTWLPTFQRYLSALPTSVMSESEYSSTFYPTALADFKGRTGQIYAIPLMYDGLGVYYNKDLLKRHGYQEPGDTWDEFLTQAQDLTEYNADGSIRIAGVGMGTGENVDFSFEIVSLLMLQEGATMVDATTNRSAFANDPDMRAANAIKYYTDYSTRYRVWDRTLPRDITMFAEGRLAMMFAPSWRVLDISDALESVGATLDYDIAPVPQQPTFEEDEINWSDYWAEAVSSESTNQAEAWKFLKFISERDPLKAWYEKLKETRAFGEIYPRQDMNSDIISNQYVGAYVKMAPTATTWKMIDKESVSQDFKQLLENVVIAGGQRVEDINSSLLDLSTNIDTLLLENQ